MRSEWLVLIVSNLQLGRKLFFSPLLFLNILLSYSGMKTSPFEVFLRERRKHPIPYLFHAAAYKASCLQDVSSPLDKAMSGEEQLHFQERKWRFAPPFSPGKTQFLTLRVCWTESSKLQGWFFGFLSCPST